VSETRETYAAWTAEHDRTPIVVSVPHERLEGSAYKSTVELLDRADRPDAVYAVSEPYATGALRAAREHGLRVPDDLLLVAGVDSHEASTGDPPITALDLHPEEQANVAVELLVARVAGRDAEVPRTVPGTLRVRRSSERGTPS
jgi:DNA-binding LacI/PurR family transcriptional regulator